MIDQQKGTNGESAKVCAIPHSVQTGTETRERK